ncbi:uncharacterized protein YbcV (DUF1398 family) [Angulomicrobium tetraedrale]|uniref:Uncharacterized protein YbcV (DUF1398 family) n=1 Tax=Ancylobacter tetraedralis TaxID=217068 RepID=A0A839ZHC2_9HYPH|nr:DUF1398 domain-containing protein [Ancylobacter tetraedralis]MBB3773952.1 uncharacterized protein YbcV (DUF1398 family) [Ancylobacter tetraedralis]
MTDDWTRIAQTTIDGSESDTISFPESVALLRDAGFDGYAVDLRAGTRIFYRPNGEAITLEAATSRPVAARFDAPSVRDAIREAQEKVPGYTYRGFCAKVAAAGCAFYLVSFPGQRVLYVARSGETHTEYFPGAQPEAR